VTLIRHCRLDIHTFQSEALLASYIKVRLGAELKVKVRLEVKLKVKIKLELKLKVKVRLKEGVECEAPELYVARGRTNLQNVS